MDRKGSREKKHTHYRKRSISDRAKNFSKGIVNSSEAPVFASTSAQKIESAEEGTYEIDENMSYSFINFFVVFTTLAANCVCKHCHGDLSFDRKNEQGIGFEVCMKCKKCGSEVSVDSSPRVARSFEINRRIVLIMRLLGIGLGGLNLFCGLMDLSNNFSRNLYYACLDKIYKASSTVYELSTTRAAAQEKELSNSENLTVSGDGTWKKRGFSSLFGAASLIGKHTRKVIDSICKSKLCQACSAKASLKSEDIDAYNKWYESHADNCTINHEGSSGKMEVDGIIEMFSRSMEKYIVRYTTYVGDGDSKTFKGILDLNPYGDEFIVRKSECVGHVEKRLGTRLRNAKKNNKSIGGKGVGRLTDAVIGQLTRYYGLAIRRHSGSIEEMRKAIWATYLHKISTDDKPQHENCPEGEDSWCAWRRAEADDAVDSFHHDYSPLSAKVQEVIKPIYEALSAEELLARCLGAETQNSNESLNSLIWTFAPKHLHSGPKVIEVANFLAVCIFNDGFSSILKIMHEMGVTIGNTSATFVDQRDQCRIIRSEGRLSDFAKRTRIERRQSDSEKNEFAEYEEGVLYGPGIAD